MNAENNHKENSSHENGKISERIPIEGTPFTIAKTEKGYTMLLGLYALTPTLKNKREVEDYWKKNEWNIMVNVMHAIMNFHGLIKQEQLNEKTIDLINQAKKTGL